jgi:hypothetical protein
VIVSEFYSMYALRFFSISSIVLRRICIRKDSRLSSRHFLAL